MPGACEVIRQKRGEIPAKKASRLRAVVGGEPANEGLPDEQHRGHEEEPHDRPLGGGEGDLRHRMEVESGGRIPPAQPVVATEAEEHDPHAAQQRDD